ncbi:MAG: hypothetical protein LBE14_03355 [Treponema sp.]|nr:hypothetical protein [Treponema sp.]
MAENAIHEPQQGLSFEDVWAALMEMKEFQKETDRELKETAQRLQKSHEETDRQLKKTDRQLKKTSWEVEKTSRIVGELSKEVGGISNHLGEVAQCFFGSDLWRHFDGFEYEFQRLYPYLPLFNEKNDPIGDIDITLLNGEYVMAIEVKTHLKKKNVEYHVKRLEQIKKYPPDQYKGRKLLGGMAGLMIDLDAKDMADEMGIYIIEQSGDAVRLAPRPEWFKAREW